MAEFGIGDLDNFGIKEGILIMKGGAEVDFTIGENEGLCEFFRK